MTEFDCFFTHISFIQDLPYQILFPTLIVVSILPTVTVVCVKMSCSLEDIKNLLAGQTEALTQVRNHERAEDIQKISEMIDISVQKHITNVIDPIVKCQDNFEAQTNSQYAAIAKEFAYLKQSLANPQPTPLKTSLTILLQRTPPRQY